jgi:hypothetical protein
MPYQRHGEQSYEIESRHARGPSGTLKRKGFGSKGRYPGINMAKQVFAEKSQRSRTQDLLKMAEIAPSVEAWLKCPNRLDLPGLDTPDAALVFSHRSKRSQAQDLARAARRKVPVEIWIGDPSKVDLQGVDTPGSKKPKPRRFKVVEKEEGKKLELKRATEEKKEGRKLPTKAEILERAQELHKVELVKQGLPVISAEEKELKESGTFEEARADLMRGEKSKADPQIEAYVHDLNGELEPLGFQVVPI